MIHQFILAAPKPGMTTAEFQEYWVHIHAPKFAGRIPQIRQYLVDTRIPSESDAGVPPLPHQGIAEIWLANETEQLASLQAPEFLQGARLDEPNWAAFWLAIVLDTTAHEIVAGDPPREAEPGWVKVTTLLKRRPGMPLDEFRRTSLGSYAPIVSALPGLRRHLHCHTNDGAYVFGESRFDGVEQLWFDDLESLQGALRSPYHAEHVAPALAGLADPRYVFSLTAREHWIIRAG
jgi:EthD domain-containing protein